jgi:hypothetical protein
MTVGVAVRVGMAVVFEDGIYWPTARAPLAQERASSVRR